MPCPRLQGSPLQLCNLTPGSLSPEFMFLTAVQNYFTLWNFGPFYGVRTQYNTSKILGNTVNFLALIGGFERPGVSVLLTQQLTDRSEKGAGCVCTRTRRPQTQQIIKNHPTPNSGSCILKVLSSTDSLHFLFVTLKIMRLNQKKKQHRLLWGFGSLAIQYIHIYLFYNCLLNTRYVQDISWMLFGMKR